MADFRKGATGNLINILFTNFAAGKDVELDASADAASYTSGNLTFTNINILYPSDKDGLVCSDVETLSQIFDDKSDESSFENDASVFAQIISSEEGEGITNKSEFNWTFFYR